MTNETTTELAPVDPIRELAARLPANRQDAVLSLSRPSPVEMRNQVDALPKELQQPILDLLSRTRPKKKGLHTTNTGFSPTNLKLFQGTGNDPARPAKLPPGNFYSADSVDRGSEIKAVILGAYQGRKLWPQRDDAGSGGGAPICYSMDRETGSKYGACRPCPLAFKNVKEGGCSREVVVFFTDEDLSGIYSLYFTGTSVSAGEGLVRVLQRSDNLWDRYFTIESVEMSRDKFRWFVIKASPTNDTKNPENNSPPKELHPIFSAFSTILDLDVYYPQLANVYDRPETLDEEDAEVSVDEDSLLMSEADDGDFSGDI